MIRPSSRGPASIRSHSAASVGSRNAPYGARFDNASTRTSSLTSIVNMYHRMPQSLGNELCGVPAPILTPRYYDYTEDFEPETSGTLACAQVPAPCLVRRINDHQLMVHTQDSDDRPITYPGHRDSAFFDGDSQRTDSGEVADATRDQLDVRVEVGPSTEGLDQSLQQLRSHTSLAQLQNATNMGHSDAAKKRFRRSRGSDIDLLPSQIGRDSMDTFNPSLDIESRDAPPYNYSHYRANVTPKTTKSPGKQVQVQDNGTPSIRSEQGIILRDDFQENSLNETENERLQVESEDSAEILDKKLDSPNGRRSISEPAQDILKTFDRRRYGRRFNTRNVVRINGPNLGSSIKQVNGLPRAGGVKGSHVQGQATTSHVQSHAAKSNLALPDELRSSREKKWFTSSLFRGVHEMRSHSQQFRCHKRNNAAFEISTTDLPQDTNEGFPQLTRRCSTTPIISPKPISPARQLRVKNSIPELMKALPPLPGDPRYKAPPPTPPIIDDEDEFAQILSPFSFSRPFAIRQSKSLSAVRPNSGSRPDHTPGLQKNIPKLRLRMRLSESPAPVQGDNRPLTSDSNSTTGALFETGNSNPLKVRPLQPRRRLKLRSPRSNAIDAAPSATIRRDPAAQRSDIIAEIADQQPRDLFHFRSGVNSAIRQVSRKLTYTNQTHRSHEISSTARRNVLIPNLDERPIRIPRDYLPKSESDVSSDAWKPRGLRKHLSNLRCLLLVRPPGFFLEPDTAHIAATEAIRGSETEGREINISLASLTRSGQYMASHDGSQMHEHPQPRFSQRVRAKLRKWVEGAKFAVRTVSQRTQDTQRDNY